MRNRTPVAIDVQFPETEEGQRELSKRVAEAHAEFVLCTIRGLNCPAAQKAELLQTVIDTAKQSCLPSRLPDT